MFLEVIMWWITRVDGRLGPSLTAVRVCMCMPSLKNHEFSAFDFQCSFTYTPKKPSNDSGPKWITWKICFYEAIGKAPRGLTYMVKSTPNELHNQIYSNKERPPDNIWTMREKPIHREDKYGCKFTNPAQKYEHLESSEDLFNGAVPRVCNPELS